jgi:hypothetical protein
VYARGDFIGGGVCYRHGATSHACMDDAFVEVDCSVAQGVVVIGQGYLTSFQFGSALTHARISLEPLKKSPWCRVIVTGIDGKRAWSNPWWKAPS